MPPLTMAMAGGGVCVFGIFMAKVVPPGWVQSGHHVRRKGAALRLGWARGGAKGLLEAKAWAVAFSTEVAFLSEAGSKAWRSSQRPGEHGARRAWEGLIASWSTPKRSGPDAMPGA